VTGAGAAVNVLLNLALIPPYGMMGAAVSTLAAYLAIFLGMTFNAQRVWPVPYQWRRVLTLSLAAAGLLVVGKALDASLPLAIALCLVYPVVLLPLRFYLPAELRRLRLS
jgi:O-antigen/teichoic acid export membrane protein